MNIDHLRLKLIDERHVEITIPEGASLHDELDDLLNRQGHYEREWVKIEGGPDSVVEYVRYDQIVGVTAKTG